MTPSLKCRTASLHVEPERTMKTTLERKFAHNSHKQFSCFLVSVEESHIMTEHASLLFEIALEPHGLCQTGFIKLAIPTLQLKSDKNSMTLKKLTKYCGGKVI